jgi:hypothetical protein
MTIHTMHFGDEGQAASRQLVAIFERLERPNAALEGYLRTMESLDRQYGGSGALPVEDAADLVSAALTELAYLEQAGRREPWLGQVADLTLGVALWAIRHGVELAPVEPVANALAFRSNAARSRQELAAVFGLMQGVIEQVRPRLAADLERSNPERGWRILHVNLAITAVRTEDAALMDSAFDALDSALPDEAPGFYAEAMALALSPGIAPAVRERIEARHGR